MSDGIIIEDRLDIFLVNILKPAIALFSGLFRASRLAEVTNMTALVPG